MPLATSVFDHQALAAAGQEGDEHGPRPLLMGQHLAGVSTIVGDPAHIMFKITATLIFDLLFMGLIYGVLIRRFPIPKLRRDFPKEFDKEHGIEHTGHDHGTDTVDEIAEEQERK